MPPKSRSQSVHKMVTAAAGHLANTSTGGWVAGLPLANEKNFTHAEIGQTKNRAKHRSPVFEQTDPADTQAYRAIGGSYRFELRRGTYRLLLSRRLKRIGA